MGCAGCSLLATTSISLAIYFNHKVLVFLRTDILSKEERLLFRGIQQTMIVQLISHFTVLVIPLIGIVLASLLSFPYLLPFMIMIECGPTVTTILTLMSVPEYRRKVKICFRKATKTWFYNEK